MKTSDFVDAIRLRHDLRSDYMVAKLLDVAPNYVSQWRRGRNTMGDDTCMKVAELLELRPEYVLACVAAERAKSESVREAWERAAAALAACLALAVGLAVPSPAPAAGGPAGGAVHIMSTVRRGLRTRQARGIQAVRLAADVVRRVIRSADRGGA